MEPGTAGKGCTALLAPLKPFKAASHTPHARRDPIGVLLADAVARGPRTGYPDRAAVAIALIPLRGLTAIAHVGHPESRKPAPEID